MRHGAVAAYAGLVWVTTSSSSHGPRAARGCDQFLRSEWAIRHFYRYTAQSTFNLAELTLADVERRRKAATLEARQAEPPATRRRDRCHEVLTKLFMWRGSAIARAGRKF